MYAFDSSGWSSSKEEPRSRKAEAMTDAEAEVVEPARAPSRPAGRLPLMFAAAITLFFPVDFIFMGRPSVWPLLVRLGWSLSLVTCWWLSGRLGARWQGELAVAKGMASTAFFLGLVLATGGMASPYFAHISILPPLVAVANSRDARIAVLSGVVSVGGVVAVVLGSGGTWGQGLSWAVVVTGSTFFGAYAASQARKMQAAEEQARLERTRREAMEQLALSERRRAQAEKLATIGRLAANVVHEINNPIAFIRSNVDFLQREVQSGALDTNGKRRQELSDVFDEVRIGVERIRQISADLKGFSYMDKEELAECQLAGVVGDAARLASLRLKHVARLRVEVPESLPPVLAIHRKLAQVVLNLLVNAGDALEAVRAPSAEVRVTGQLEGGRVVVLVEDNGPGFAPDVLPRLFEAFFTTKGPEKGTGLGLALSREMVEQFGGTLSAENRPEGGARLRLELPVQPSAAS
jgi:signal transduction histidine kinase